MHPAFSVIIFTSVTGAGYGLLGLLCALGALGIVPGDRWFGAAGFGISFTAISAGLIASTFHLGHPERAWRAFSQWRSSWLSREGVLSVLTYGPGLWFAKGWVWDGTDPASAPWQWYGLATATLSLLTVISTAMIYASLKPIPRWRHPLVLPAYLLLGLATGGLWLNVLLHGFGFAADDFAGAIALALMLAWLVKVTYWYSIDRAPGRYTAEHMTGLWSQGSVRQLEAPHAQENYLTKEMGFQIARRHAGRLRRVALIAGLAAPLLLTIAAVLMPRWSAFALSIPAAGLAMAGVLVERWLFFAEAKHVVTLYYGADRV
jgi:DMSO reductase anchor subunit